MSFIQDQQQINKLSLDPTKTNLLRRSMLFENVELMLSKVIAFKEEAKNDSEDLFADVEEVSNQKVELKPLKNFNELEVLLKEKEFLGLYVTNNPVANYTPFVEYIKTNIGAKDLYLVMIDKIKKIYTKSKDMMFALEVSTDGQKIEGVVFSKNAMAFSPIIEEKQLFWVRGKISTPKKRKQETVASSETESETMDVVEEVREFVELPKLIFDQISPFDSGVLGLYTSDKDNLSEVVKAELAQIDYSQVKLYPELFQTAIKEQKQDINNHSETKKLVIFNTITKQNAKSVKDILTKSTTLANDKYLVDVYIQNKDGVEIKSKQNYYLSQEELAKLNQYL
jgi:hypothetical protein